MRLKAAHPPRCPFCDQPIDPPREPGPERPGDFAHGECLCGAVYVHDVTGYDLGAAFVEALGYGTDFNWDLAWDLVPQEDYEERYLEQYDLRTHMIHPSGRTEDERRVRGILLFLKFVDEIREFRAGPTTGSPRKRPQALTTAPDPADKGSMPPKISFSKRDVKKAVAGNDYANTITHMATQDPKVLNRLQQLLYTPDPTARWRTIESIGAAARVIHEYRPGFVGEFLRRLLYSASDSAATNWGAIEAAGEIIRNIPAHFNAFIRELISLMRFEDSRVNVLTALERIAESHPKLLKQKTFFDLIRFLDTKAPEVRGLTARILGKIEARECMNAIEKLTHDHTEFSLTTPHGEERFTVSALAMEALKKLKGESPAVKDVEYSETLKKGLRIFQEAEVLFNQGRTLDAVDRYEEALGIFEDESFHKGIANACEKLGDLHCFRGNLNQALPFFQRALTICNKQNDPIGEVIILDKIIDFYKRQGKHDQCLPYYLRALELAEMASDAARAGYYLTGLGDIYQGRGELEKALDAYRTAHGIFIKVRQLERAKIIEEGIASIEKSLDA